MKESSTKYLERSENRFSFIILTNMIFFAIIGVAIVATLVVLGARAVLAASEKYSELSKSNEALRRELDELKSSKS